MLTTKYLQKSLQNVFKKLLIDHIRENQAGFLPGRHIRDNLRMVIDCLEYGDKVTMEKLGFLFLDAEKAFDNMN